MSSERQPIDNRPIQAHNRCSVDAGGASRADVCTSAEPHWRRNEGGKYGQREGDGSCKGPSAAATEGAGSQERAGSPEGGGSYESPSAGSEVGPGSEDGAGPQERDGSQLGTSSTGGAIDPATSS